MCRKAVPCTCMDTRGDLPPVAMCVQVDDFMGDCLLFTSPLFDIVAVIQREESSAV